MMRNLPQWVHDLLSGDFCSVPKDIYGRAWCVPCMKWFKVTIFNVIPNAPDKKCKIHGVTHISECCDCFQLKYIEKKKKS